MINGEKKDQVQIGHLLYFLLLPTSKYLTVSTTADMNRR
jgi:hypothetical protein